MSSFRKWIFPSFGATVPVMVFNRVDFPAPFGPRTARHCPSSISKDSPSSTIAEPYPEVTLVSLRIDKISTSLSKIGFDYFRIIDDFCWRTFSNLFTIVNGNNSLNQLHEFLQTMFNENDGGTIFFISPSNNPGNGV